MENVSKYNGKFYTILVKLPFIWKKTTATTKNKKSNRIFIEIFMSELMSSFLILFPKL